MKGEQKRLDFGFRDYLRAWADVGTIVVPSENQTKLEEVKE